MAPVPGSDLTAAAAHSVRAARQAVLRLVGDVDAATQLHFRAEADELLLDDDVTGLVVDLGDTTLMDSSGLALLVHLKMLSCDNAISLVLRHVPPRIRSLLALTQLDRVLDIETDSVSTENRTRGDARAGGSAAAVDEVVRENVRDA